MITCSNVNLAFKDLLRQWEENNLNCIYTKILFFRLFYANRRLDIAAHTYNCAFIADIIYTDDKAEKHFIAVFFYYLINIRSTFTHTVCGECAEPSRTLYVANVVNLHAHCMWRMW